MTEGNWTSVPYSDPLKNESYAPWASGEPNGDTIENCATLHLTHIGNSTLPLWNDIDCKRKYCTVCSIPTVPIFIIRGIEYDISSKFDSNNFNKYMQSNKAYVKDHLLMHTMVSQMNTLTKQKFTSSVDLNHQLYIMILINWNGS